MAAAAQRDLAATLGALRSGELDLRRRIDELAASFDEREARVLSLMPEPNRFERLHREAEALLAKHPAPASRPALFGALLGVKDVFRVDGFETRAGSRLPPSTFAGPEASSVTRLRRAGALVLGKTVSTEFAYFAPGPTRNPRDSARTPGGSSSGSAAAVGAGLCDVALGTQTIGSVTRPASFCGVVGCKPSFGRVPTDGIIPLAPGLDHVGWFAAEVAGARLVAAELLEAAPSSPGSPEGTRPRLAIPIGPYLDRADADGRKHFEGACERLRSRGYEIADLPAMLDFDEIEARHRRIVAAETAAVHANWFAEFRDLYAPQTIELIERGQKIPTEQLEIDLGGRSALRRELAALLDGAGCQAWISPSARGVAPLGLASTGDPVMNLPWTQAGLPTLGIPAGLGQSGLPIGLQLAARFGDDAPLFAWAEAIERTLQKGCPT
ncbi:MAG: amidase [Acidobacteriota bacterium]